MLYEVVYDPVSGWKPCSIKARVAPGAGSGPPLREHFEVTDSVQGRWLRTGRMLVADRHKLDLTSVAFSVTPTAVLTSDELVQCQGHQGGCSLRLEHHGSPQQQLNFMLDTEDKFYSGFAWETGAASPGRCWLDSAMRDRAVAGRDLEPIFALDSLSRKGASSASIVSAAALGLPPQLLRLPKATGTRGQVLRFLWSSLRMKRKLAKPVSQVEAAPAPVWSVVVGETLPPAEQLLASPPPATGACPVCRKTLALGARFCGSCGAHLP